MRPIAFASSLLSLAIACAHAEVPAPVDSPYPGTIAISVDATDLAQRIFRVKQVVPVQPGPLTLLLPQWLPGNHAPNGPIDIVHSPFTGCSRRGGSPSDRDREHFDEWRVPPRGAHAEPRGGGT